jgi:hypothetical protein
MSSIMELPPSYATVTATSGFNIQPYQDVSDKPRQRLEDKNRLPPEEQIQHPGGKKWHRLLIERTQKATKSTTGPLCDETQHPKVLPTVQGQEPDSKSAISDTNTNSSSSYADDESDSDDASTIIPEKRGVRVNIGFPGSIVMLGRKLKDRMTHTTHEEREMTRRLRAAERERVLRWEHKIRRTMSKAMDSGQPQYLHTDGDGMDVYVEPPDRAAAASASSSKTTTRDIDTNPLSPYHDPNARFVKPKYTYDDLYGYETVELYGVCLTSGVYGGSLIALAAAGGIIF